MIKLDWEEIKRQFREYSELPHVRELREALEAAKQSPEGKRWAEFRQSIQDHIKNNPESFPFADLRQSIADNNIEYNKNNQLANSSLFKSTVKRGRPRKTEENYAEYYHLLAAVQKLVDGGMRPTDARKKVAESMLGPATVDSKAKYLERAANHMRKGQKGTKNPAQGTKIQRTKTDRKSTK